MPPASDGSTLRGGSSSSSTSADALAADHDLTPEMRRKVAEWEKGGPFGLRGPVVWTNVLRMTVLHLLGLAGVLVAPRASATTWLFFFVYLMFSGLGITAGVHRLWSHRSYKAGLPLRILLMCFNCVAMQNDIFVWSRDHRVHHKYSETDADPHNVKRGFFFAHVGWLLMHKHPDVLIKGRTVDLSDLKRDGVVMFQHRYYLTLCFLFTLLLPTLIPWYFWGENPWVAFFFCFAFRYVETLHSTWFVNSAAHMWGSRRYDKWSNPSDNRFVSMCAMGEGFHNYHHAFPYDYGTSEWGPSMNVTTTFIDMCAALGQAYDRKQVSHEAIERMRRRIGDLSD